MELIRGLRYRVKRTGEDTKYTSEFLTYTVEWTQLDGWHIRGKGGNLLYSASHGCFENPKYWEISSCLDDADMIETMMVKHNEQLNKRNQRREKCMSFDKVDAKELAVETGVTLVNGQKLDKFSDVQVIAMIKAERGKLETLEKDVGATSKYYKAKAMEVATAIKVLADELDRRVA